MDIFKCDISACNTPIDYEYPQHRFSIKVQHHIRGTFWQKEAFVNSHDVINGEIVDTPDDYSLGGSWGVSYTNNIPQRLVYRYIDYNGKIIESNSIPIYTDANGCVIESHYDDTENAAKEYGSIWDF